jgi:hypothetical protein
MYAYAKGNPIRHNDPTGQCVGSIGSLVCDVLEPYITSSNLSHTAKEGFFILNNPVISARLGHAKIEGTLSKKSSDFAINATAPEGNNFFDQRQSERGTEQNAMRHVIWQAIATRNFGEQKAKNIASSHEVNPKADKTRRNFSSLVEADEVVDLLNNEIGREIGKSNPNMSNSQLAVHVASYMKQQGLYVAKPSNGGYVVSQQKTTPQQFSKQISSLSKTGNNGKYKK